MTTRGVKRNGGKLIVFLSLRSHSEETFKERERQRKKKKPSKRAHYVVKVPYRHRRVLDLILGWGLELRFQRR